MDRWMGSRALCDPKYCWVLWDPGTDSPQAGREHEAAGLAWGALWVRVHDEEEGKSEARTKKQQEKTDRSRFLRPWPRARVKAFRNR